MLDNLSLSCDGSGEKVTGISGKMVDDEQALSARKASKARHSQLESNLEPRSD